jgi:hypothetical protein
MLTNPVQGTLTMNTRSGIGGAFIRKGNHNVCKWKRKCHLVSESSLVESVSELKEVQVARLVPDVLTTIIGNLHTLTYTVFAIVGCTFTLVARRLGRDEE